ncbi:hypothetical protein Tsubulata_029606, partial [Turnera subulata]
NASSTSATACTPTLYLLHNAGTRHSPSDSCEEEDEDRLRAAEISERASERSLLYTVLVVVYVFFLLVLGDLLRT